MIKPGQMRYRVTVKQRSTTRNALGEPQQVWDEVGIFWASKEPLIGDEFFKAEAVQSRVNIKFRLRYTPVIDGTMRLEHNGDTYEILGEPVNVNGLNRELLLYCQRVVV